MAKPTQRLTDRVRRDFSSNVVERLIDELTTLPEALPLGDSLDAERIQAALVISASGNYRAFRIQMELAHLDWRDVLVNAGLGDGDWQKQLARELE